MNSSYALPHSRTMAGYLLPHRSAKSSNADRAAAALTPV